MPDFLGFQLWFILNLHGIPFHAVVVFEPEQDFLFKSASTYCGRTWLCSFKLRNTKSVGRKPSLFFSFFCARAEKKDLVKTVFMDVNPVFIKSTFFWVCCLQINPVFLLLKPFLWYDLKTNPVFLVLNAVFMRIFFSVNL